MRREACIIAANLLKLTYEDFHDTLCGFTPKWCMESSMMFFFSIQDSLRNVFLDEDVFVNDPCYIKSVMTLFIYLFELEKFEVLVSKNIAEETLAFFLKYSGAYPEKCHQVNSLIN
jgi:hypothetical protein